MANKFVTVMTFHQSFEAQLAKNLLDNEGIASVLWGEQMSDLQFSNSAMGDQIVLQVDEDDAQRAAALLAAVAAARLDEDWEEQAESGAGVWLCSICGEPVSNRLSICYSCQTPRGSIRAAAPRDPTAIQADPATLPTGKEVQKRDEIADAPTQAPPTPPMPPTEFEHPTEESDEPTAPASPMDDFARRAFLASLLGLVTMILLPFAWYYLLGAVLAGGELSQRGLRYLYGALLINGLIVFLVLLLCAGIRH